MLASERETDSAAGRVRPGVESGDGHEKRRRIGT